MAETALTKFNDVFMPMVQQQLVGHEIHMTDYQKMCVLSGSQNLYEIINSNNINPNDPVVKNDVTNILMTIASLQLNANAQPSEVYFQTRNFKVGNDWKKTVEMGIEGDGNDAILSRFGRHVKFVYDPWVVREGDEYKPPRRKGIKITDPEWESKSVPDAKAIRIVYPIEFWTDDKKLDSTVQYFETTRDLVKPNLLAHMLNNIQSERRKNPSAHAEHVSQITEFAKSHTVDEILDDETMNKIGHISPAWSEPQSREQMIIRKMRNNIVKRIPKDFSNGLIASFYEEESNESVRNARREVNDNANSQDFEAIESDGVVEGEVVESEEPSESISDETVDNSSEREAESVSEAPKQAKGGAPF